MKIIQTALSQYGVKEIVGRESNPQILKYFKGSGLDPTKMNDETAWCSAFANWVAKEAGYEQSGKLNARSWLTVGESTDTPEPGDVVVLWRESPESWKGHVGFFIRETKRYVYMIGGNQKNQVNIKAFPKTRILDYRKLQSHG